MVPGKRVVMMRKALLISAAAVIAVSSSMGFEPPGPQKRLEAIGRTDGLPAVLQRALAPDDSFQPVPVPGPSDWLAVHREPGQTFEQFRRLRPNQPDAHRRIIYLQPLGAFPEQQSPSLEKLGEYAAVFFQMEVKVLAPVSASAGGFTSRTNSTTGRRQILTEDVLHWLKGKLPADGFCLLAITMEDLYPEASWNFVFGQASLTDPVGVYSFARYDPAFYGETRGKDYQALLLRRSISVGLLRPSRRPDHFGPVPGGELSGKEPAELSAHRCGGAEPPHPVPPSAGGLQGLAAHLASPGDFRIGRTRPGVERAPRWGRF